MHKTLLVLEAAFCANAAAAGEPSQEAVSLVEASQKALAVNWQCAEAIGLPALYEAQKTIAIRDMQAVGVSRDEAVVMIHDGARKIEETRQAGVDKSAICRKLMDDARNELDYARAKYRLSIKAN